MAPISDIQRQTYTDIYKTYSGKLYGVCLHYVHDPDIASDLLHDSFIVIFSSLDKLRDSSKLEPWMCSIVRNIALKHLKDCQRMPATSLETIPEPVFEETSVDVSEIPLAELLKFIDTLPEQYGKVFRLSVLEGLSHKEIGDLLGIAPHSSSSNLARAKQILRKVISQNWGIILTFCLCIFALVFALIRKEEEQITAESVTFEVIRPEVPEIRIAVLAHTKALKNRNEVEAAKIPETQKETYETMEADIIPRDTADLEERVKPEETALTHANEAKTDTATERNSISNGRERFTFGFSGAIGNSGKSGAFYPAFDMAPPVQTPGYEDPVIPVPEREYTHHMPISFTASVQWAPGERWALAGGLRYTYLHSEIKEGMGTRTYGQDIHYLGIPFKVSWTFWNSRSSSAYVSAGTTFEFPIAGRLGMDKITVPCQWSAGLGIGFQYSLTPHVGLYVEPELYRYFNNGSQIRTIRTERSVSLTVPVGIRFSW